ncbi:MAG: heavy-metal-associated domain-containing protein [Gammaproteobacteria bacterium]|nr:heavy-metal-associated domain-containing protein [Gammaproteobacteria bacterium]
MNLTYSIEGIHCPSCIHKISSVLSPHVNIIEITLNPPLLKIEAERPPNLDALNAHLALIGNYKLQARPTHHLSNSKSLSMADPEPQGWRVYYPIFLIMSYIIGVAGINNFHAGEINWQSLMNQFMAGFFLIFSAFKFLDIRGFAEGYATYDLLAQRWHTYGYIYPFLELVLGILYLTQELPTLTQFATIVIMGFSSLGVINSLLKKQKIHCACLGTLLKVPLSSITLIEDLTMVILAVVALMMRN